MEDISKIFNKIKLKTYKTAQGDRFFDRIRNIFVNITPEEIVRQRMIKYLIDYIKVPIQNIRVEDHLTHWNVRKYNGRMDIVLTYFDESEEDDVLAVIECKEENIYIESRQFFEQAVNYSKLVKSKYMILVNGIDLQFYYSDDFNEYYPIEILTYDEMLKDIHVYIPDENNFKRLNYNDYFNYEFLSSQDWFYDKIGEDTSVNLIPCIINLDDCLWDYSVKLQKLTSQRFKLVEDLGIQYREYGNASGSTGFGAGYYRVFIINDNKYNFNFLSGFSISTTGKTENDPIYGNRQGQSVLAIMYNDGNLDELSVELNLNKFLILDERNRKAGIIHSGVVSRKGARKADFFQYIQSNNINLVRYNEIQFGTIDYSIPLTFNNYDVINLFSNMIEYSVYRIEYKKSLKK